MVPAPALEIPKKHHGKTIHTDYVFAIFIAVVYASFLVYTHFFAMSLRPPPYLLSLDALLHLRLNLFWVDAPGCVQMAVRDIYRMEFEIFQSLDWCLLYLAAVIIYSTHMCRGWQKVVPAPALEIPKKHHGRAIHMGYVFAVVCASFPVYTHLFAMSLCPPPYLLSLDTLLHLRLNLDTPGCEKVVGRDVRSMEFEIFQSLAVIFCSTHMCLAWQKVVPAPALENPKRHHGKAILMGYVFAIFTAMVYASLLVYTHLFRHALVPAALGGHPRLREGGCAGHLPLGVRDLPVRGLVPLLPGGRDHLQHPHAPGLAEGGARTGLKLAPGGSQGISVLRLAISRLIFLAFMTMHLLQFRFDDTDQSRLCYIKPPPYLISFWRITSLNLFRTHEGGIQPVGVRDICALELRLHETPVVLLLHPLRALLPVPSGEHPAELPRAWISPPRGHFRERRGLPVWRCSSQQGWKRHQPSGEHPAGHAHPRIPCELLGNFSNCQDVTGGAVRLFGCPPQWTGCCNTKGRFSSPCFDVGVFGGGDRLLWNHPALPHNFPWPGHLAAFVPGC